MEGEGSEQMEALKEVGTGSVGQSVLRSSRQVQFLLGSTWFGRHTKSAVKVCHGDRTCWNQGPWQLIHIGDRCEQRWDAERNQQ